MPDRVKCPGCGTLMQSKKENYKYTMSGLPNVTLLDIEVRCCAQCGEREVVIWRMEDLHRVLAVALICKRSRLTPQEIRFLRKYLGWSGTDMARHMGVTVFTISRWESLTYPHPMGGTADRLLRMAVAHGQPVAEYPIENLTQVAGDEAVPAKLGLRVGRSGWEAEQLAVC